MRLIDADAFVEAIKKDLRKYPEDDLIYPVMEWFLDNIKSRPTIEQPTWISVEDGLPETIACSAGTAYSEAVLVFTTGKKVLIGIFDGEDFLSDGIDYWDAEHDEVTHWMPLPQQPKGDE